MSFTDLRRLVSAFPILHTLSLYDMDVKLGANELNAIYTACVSPRLTFVKIDGLINPSMDCYAYLWLSTRPRPSQKPSKTSSHPTSSIRLSHLDARLFTKLVELQSESAGTLTKLRWRKLFAWIKEEDIWVLKHLQFSRCVCAFIFSTRDLRSAHHYHYEETPKLQVIVLVHRIEDVYDRYDWRKMDNLFSSFGHHLGIHIEIIIEDNNSNEKTETKTIAERIDVVKSKIPWIWDHLHPNVWIGDRIYNIDYKSFDPQNSIMPSLPKTIQDSIFI
ncbi:hypothetical protein C8Q75DRAFT_576677 [Abortiporus biennis]|nr:hypothetical protein C8Q75DRAFT_576677 [Abortiporus biennis]